MDSKYMLSLIGVIAGCIQTVIMAVAAVFALRQLKQAETTRRSQIGFHFVNRLNDVAARKRRYEVYGKICKKKPTRLSTKDEETLGLVANEFHSLGYMVSCGLVDKDLVLGLYYGTVARLWRAMLPWIEIQRNKRGTRYAEYFEYLAVLSEEYIQLSRPAETVRLF